MSPSSSDVLVGVAQVAAGGKSVAVSLSSLLSVVSVISHVLLRFFSGYHTCALMMGTGGVKCWGEKVESTLGIGNLT